MWRVFLSDFLLMLQRILVIVPVLQFFSQLSIMCGVVICEPLCRRSSEACMGSELCLFVEELSVIFSALSCVASSICSQQQGCRQTVCFGRWL